MKGWCWHPEEGIARPRADQITSNQRTGMIISNKTNFYRVCPCPLRRPDRVRDGTWQGTWQSKKSWYVFHFWFLQYLQTFVRPNLQKAQHTQTLQCGYTFVVMQFNSWDGFPFPIQFTIATYIFRIQVLHFSRGGLLAVSDELGTFGVGSWTTFVHFFLILKLGKIYLTWMKIAHWAGAAFSRQLKQFSGDWQFFSWHLSTEQLSLQSVTWTEVVVGQDLGAEVGVGVG